MSALVHVDTVEAVWNQNKGVVQLFVNGLIHMELPPVKANEMSSAIGHAAAVPVIAASMALRPPVNPTQIMVSPMGGIMADASGKFPQWTPEAGRNAMLAQAYGE